MCGIGVRVLAALAVLAEALEASAASTAGDERWLMTRGQKAKRASWKGCWTPTIFASTNSLSIMTLRHLHRALPLVLCLGLLPASLIAQQIPGMDSIPIRTRPADPMPDSLLFDARDAIVRGMVYFGAPDRKLDVDAALLQAYVKDRFGLPELCSMKEVLATIRENPKEELYKFLCLADTITFKPHFLDRKGQGFNDITVAGMWYDKLPDRSLLAERINEVPSDQVYMATHALWAISMAQHCFQAEFDTVMEQRLVAEVMDVMERTRPNWDDHAIEALAMAQYHDPGYVPPWQYIQEIIAMQNPDGSWNWVPDKQKVNGSQHTTILALWALLQYKPLAWPTRPRPMVLR